MVALGQKMLRSEISLLNIRRKMIIGLCGFIGSGKDTVADYLVNSQSFLRESFAGTLKDAVAAVFGWNREMLEGKTAESRAWRETVDPWWALKLNNPNLTPRWVLQQWGTEVCRQNFNDQIWALSLENKLRTTTSNVVVTDCRFPNEINAIKSQGGKVIWVRRGPMPDWYPTAVKAMLSNDPVQIGLLSDLVHPSESSWINSKFDSIIDNNGTLEELHSQVEWMISNLVLDRQFSMARRSV